MPATFCLTFSGQASNHCRQVADPWAIPRLGLTSCTVVQRIRNRLAPMMVSMSAAPDSGTSTAYPACRMARDTVTDSEFSLAAPPHAGCLHDAGITVQKKATRRSATGLFLRRSQRAMEANAHPFGMGRGARFRFRHAGLGQGAATEEKRLNGLQFGHGDGPRHGFAVVQTLRVGFPFLAF